MLPQTTRPANCSSLDTTRVDELSWQRSRPRTKSSDARTQFAHTCVVKSVIVLAKIIDKAALNLKERFPDLTWSSGNKLDNLQNYFGDILAIAWL